MIVPQTRIVSIFAERKVGDVQESVTAGLVTPHRRVTLPVSVQIGDKDINPPLLSSIMFLIFCKV